MFFQLPWYIWLALGVFLGLFLGNKKFKSNVEQAIGKMLSSKPRKPEQQKEIRQETRQDTSAVQRQCRLCHNWGEMALEYDGGGLCRHCLQEILDAQRSSSKRGTRIREIHFED